MSSNPVINTLGYAGLIPFVVPALLTLSSFGHSEVMIDLIEVYAFGIICFLVGSWWGMGLKTGKRITLILSNFFFLIAFFIFVFAPSVWMPVAVVMLISIFMTERIESLFPEFESGYRTMRAVLTLVASLSLIVTYSAG